MFFSKFVLRSGIKSIAAISDIHGWYRPLVELLEKGGIIERAADNDDKAHIIGDDRFLYSGEEMVIVINGDFLETGGEGKKVMELFLWLEKEMPKAGGELIVLLGNHERNHLVEEDKYWDQIQEYRNWIESRPITAIVNNILFVHAGISSKAYDMIEDAQKDDEDFLSSFKRQLEENETIRWQVTNRTFTLNDKETLNKIIEQIGIEYMVIGHAAPYGKERDEMKLVGPKIDGRPRVFNIDTNMGNWYVPDGPDKCNGGMLLLKWKGEELETEFIYRCNHENSKNTQISALDQAI